MKIRNSVAFVTGANRGIGLVFAQQLLAAGARKVYAAARNPERIPVDRVTRIALDVTDPDAVASAAIECPDVNILINNAGIARWTGFLSPDSVEIAREEMETNYFGPLFLSRAFAPVSGEERWRRHRKCSFDRELDCSPKRRNLQRFQGCRLGVDELAADWLAGSGNTGTGCACWSRGHRHG